MQSSR